ncbi:MAG TPA: leukotriene A4 hydrolase C-terminal domain-containing protein, partial [Thermoanaerobaculia bacterium]
DLIGRVPFDAFLKKYFETFAFRWVDDRNFLALLRSTIAFDEQAMRVDGWVYGTGVPSNITAPTSSVLLSRAQQRATAFNNGTPFSQLNPQTWSDVDIDLFVQIAPMNASRMAEIDAALGLSLRVTPPLSWLVAAGYANYTPALPAIERALMRGGPNSWITTIYRALSSTSSGRTRALDIFSRARDRYHDNIENSVNQILNSNNANLEENAA